jgi:hypothetical protein
MIFIVLISNHGMKIVNMMNEHLCCQHNLIKFIESTKKGISILTVEGSTDNRNIIQYIRGPTSGHFMYK